MREFDHRSRFWSSWWYGHDHGILVPLPVENAIWPRSAHHKCHRNSSSTPDWGSGKVQSLNFLIFFSHFSNSSTFAHSQFHLVCWNHLFIKKNRLTFMHQPPIRKVCAESGNLTNLLQFQVIHGGEILADPWLLPHVKPPFPCWTCEHT